MRNNRAVSIPDADIYGQWRWAVALLLGMLMIITRYQHFGSALLLPDASWPIFIAAGFYLHQSRWLVLFLALAAAIDYFAITQGGVEAYCISPAYTFLVPAYASLWWGGRWFAAQYRGSVKDIFLLAWVIVVSTSVCFVISNGAYHWLSGQYDNTTIANYWRETLKYYPRFLRATALYTSVFAAAHAIIVILRDIYGGDWNRGIE